MDQQITENHGRELRDPSQRRSGAAVVALIACAVIGSSCTYMQPASEIAETGEILVEVAIGDTVRVLTKYGERPVFEVTEISPEALVGADIRIAYDDMVFVERLTVSGIGTTAVVLSIVGSIVVVREFEEALGEAFEGAGERVLESIFVP